MNFRLRPDLVPDGLESHPDHGIKALELSVPDIQVFKVKILQTRSAIYVVG